MSDMKTMPFSKYFTYENCNQITICEDQDYSDNYDYNCSRGLSGNSMPCQIRSLQNNSTSHRYSSQSRITYAFSSFPWKLRRISEYARKISKFRYE